MKFHTARIKHDPPNSYGDCFRTSLACLLDCDKPEDVPHFFDDNPQIDKVWNDVCAWLNERKLASFFIHYPGECSIDEIGTSMKHSNPGLAYIVFGSTAANTDHCAIYRDDAQIHNVAWFGGSLVGPASNGFWTVYVVVPKFLIEP